MRRSGKVIKLYRFFKLHSFDRSFKALNIEDAVRLIAAERAPLARWCELQRTTKGYDVKFYGLKGLIVNCACLCSTRGELHPLRIDFF